MVGKGLEVIEKTVPHPHFPPLSTILPTKGKKFFKSLNDIAISFAKAKKCTLQYFPGSYKMFIFAHSKEFENEKRVMRSKLKRHRSSLRKWHYLVRSSVPLGAIAGYATDFQSDAQLSENRLSPYARMLGYLKNSNVVMANTCNDKIVILDTELSYIGKM